MAVVTHKIEILEPTTGRIVVDLEEARKIYEALKAYFEKEK